MSIDLVKRLATFVVLVLVQGLVFNHIHLFNCATPLLYIIMVLHFRRNHPKWAVLLWCFMMGLCVDVFANTPGVAAASMTAVDCYNLICLNFSYRVTAPTIWNRPCVLSA